MSGTLTITLPGSTMLDALEAYRSGDLSAARDLASQARRQAPTPLVARYADGLIYAAIQGASPASAGSAVRRFLVACDDSRYRDFPAPYNLHGPDSSPA